MTRNLLSVMVMKNNEGLEKCRVEQPKGTGLSSTTWDPGLAPGTGNDDREKTGEI